MAYDDQDQGSAAPAIIGAAAVGGGVGAGTYYYTKNKAPAAAAETVAEAEAPLIRTAPKSGTTLKNALETLQDKASPASTRFQELKADGAKEVRWRNRMSGTGPIDKLTLQRGGEYLTKAERAAYDQPVKVAKGYYRAHKEFHKAQKTHAAKLTEFENGLAHSSPSERAVIEMRRDAYVARQTPKLAQMESALDHSIADYMHHVERHPGLIEKVEAAAAKAHKGKVGVAVLAGVGAAAGGAWLANSLFNSGPSHADRELARRAAAMGNRLDGPGA